MLKKKLDVYRFQIDYCKSFFVNNHLKFIFFQTNTIKHMKKVFFIFLFFIFNSVFACLNYSIVGTDVHGKKVENSGERIPYFEINSIDKKQYEEFAKNDLSEYQKTKNIRFYIDYATSLVYLGEYEKAISIFKEIEEKQPNTYEVASNLGTVFELIGDNKNALIWIEKALKLNDESHHGSEWIHVAILKKKLGLINSDNILNIDFGNDEIPKTKLNKQQLQQFISDLTYQLSERNQFVKPKEAIVARLYYDLGNALALNLDLESAIKAYKLAKVYGYQDLVFEKRIHYFQELISKNSDSGEHIDENMNENNSFILLVSIILGLILITITIFIVKKILKKKKHNRF